MVRRVLVFAVMVSGFWAFGAPKANPEITSLMHDFYIELGQLKPLMTSDKEFQKKRHQKKIGESIDKLYETIRNKPAGELKSAAGFNITYQLLARHIKETKKVYDAGELEYARMQLASMSQYCVACHNRLPQKMDSLASQWTVNPFKVGKSPRLEDAEFLFIGRAFEAALGIYTSFIRAYRQKTGKAHELDQALKRKLGIFARVKRNPQAAIVSFSEDLKNRNLPHSARKNIEAWIDRFEKWKNEKGPDFESLPNEDFLKTAGQEIRSALGGRSITSSSPELVPLLRYSGYLYERLFQKTRSGGEAEMLLLLAKAEKKLRPVLNYSLSDIYLKECVVQFPGDPLARECLKEYRDQMADRFPSRVPDYIQATINELEQQLEKSAR